MCRYLYTWVQVAARGRRSHWLCEPSGQGAGNWILVLSTELPLQAPVTLGGNSIQMNILQCTSGMKAGQYQAAQFSFLEQALGFGPFWPLSVL